MRIVGPNCLGVLVAFDRPQCELLPSCRRGRPAGLHLAVGRHPHLGPRLGGRPRHRLFGDGLHRQRDRRASRRSHRPFRLRSRDLGDPSLRRIRAGCGRVHVRGPPRRAHQAGHPHEGRPLPGGRQGGAVPHGRACRVGRRLRGGVPARRHRPRGLPGRALRRGRDPQPRASLHRRGADDRHEWRRRRGDRGGLPPRDGRPAFGPRRGDEERTRRRPAEDVVARQPGRHRRRRRRGPLPRRPEGRPRRSRDPCGARRPLPDIDRLERGDRPRRRRRRRGAPEGGNGTEAGADLLARRGDRRVRPGTCSSRPASPPSNPRKMPFAR